MKNHFKIDFYFGLLAFWCFVTPLNTFAKAVDWTQLKTEKIEILNASSGQGDVISSYPAKLHQILGKVISWDPATQLNTPTQLVSILERYQDHQNTRFSFVEMMRNLSVDFDLSDRTHFRKVWFHLRPDLKVRGLLAIQDFTEKRPLVILRLGIHGNVDEMLAEKFILRALFDDLKMNVLVLENLTSHAFLLQNSKVTFGGLEEGLHSFLILQMLSDSKYPLSSLVSSYHMVGVSLGGQGTFVTAMLDNANEKKIKSILDFCPLINLKETFNNHIQKNLMNVGIDFWNAHRLQVVYDRYPKQLSGLELWKMPFDRVPRFTARVLDILNGERKTSLLTAKDIESQYLSVQWPKNFLAHLEQSKSFYDLNNFWSLYQGVSIPITIYTTPKDFLVSNNLNTDRILENKQPGDFKSVKIMNLQRGTHCGLASVYLWSDVVKYIQSGLGF